MLNAEQTRIVREQIAKVLEIEPALVVPAARLFADLGGTGEHLKPLRLAIEAALPVQIEPIVNQVNARTTVDDNGLLTNASLSQIVEYLGDWEGRPHEPVAFPDLFTVGMIEATVAKGLDVSSRDDAVVLEQGPLQLPPEMANGVHKVVADIYQIPLADVNTDLNLVALADDEPLEFVTVLMKVREVLGIEINVELDQMRRWLEEASSGTATPLTMQRLGRLIPNLDSLPDDAPDPTSTVGLIERLCAAAIERRESPEAAQTRTMPREQLGLYLSKWTWHDQDWWASLPGQLGTERFRLYLAGMLRAAFMHRQTLDTAINEILEVIETHAETGQKADLLAKKFRAVNKWKWWRNPLWGGLLCILKPECTAEDGGGILGRLESAYGWTQLQVVTAAHRWLKSLVPPEGIVIEPAWCTPEVLELARRMHDLRTFVEFPKLGDRLEQAGCQVSAILDHCRDPEQRHLRGDWLLAALLAVPVAAAPKSRRKGSGPSAKPKKAKPPTMSARQKKEFKELLMRDQGGVPIALAWSSIWQADHSRHNVSFVEKDRTLSAEALKVLSGNYPARMLVLPNTAIVRRLQLSSAAELQQALVLNARASLVIWHSSPYYFNLAEYLCNAFAAADEPSVRWVLRELPSRPAMEYDADNWAYLALRAIAARDDHQMATLVDRWPHPAESDRVSLLERGLLPILQRSALGVAAALNDMLERERKSDAPEGFGAVSLTTHACYQAARWYSPDLVAIFDVQQTYPWDAEFHETTLATPQPLEGFDFSTTPEPLREMLLTQQIPPWLRQLQNCPRNLDKTVALVLTDIGPEPDAVFKKVSGLLGHWTREDFDHRTSRLPLTLTSSTSPESCHFLIDPFTRAGAKVEIYRD
jgi:hypothetical protein